jgi:hypothetical protein
MDVLLMAEGGTTTSWVWGPMSVLTWLGRARRVWSDLDAMVEMTGGNGRLRSVEAVMVSVEVRE